MSLVSGGSSWSQGDEESFIRNIGMFARKGIPSKETKIQLLRGYLDGCRLRTEWGSLDPERCTALAKQELMRLATPA